MFHLGLQAGPHPAHREYHQAPEAWGHFCVPWPRIADNVKTLYLLSEELFVLVAPAVVSRRGVCRVGRGTVAEYTCRQIDSCDNERPTTPVVGSSRQGDGVRACCLSPAEGRQNRRFLGVRTSEQQLLVVVARN